MSGNLIYARISLGLVVLTCSILVGLDLAGLLPRQSSNLARSRIMLCESLALESTAALDRKDFASIRRLFDAVVRRNDDALSIGLRSRSGRIDVSRVAHLLNI